MYTDSLRLSDDWGVCRRSVIDSNGVVQELEVETVVLVGARDDETVTGAESCDGVQAEDEMGGDIHEEVREKG